MASANVVSFGTSTKAIYTTDDHEITKATFIYKGISYEGMPVAFVTALILYCQLKNL